MVHLAHRSSTCHVSQQTDLGHRMALWLGTLSEKVESVVEEFLEGAHVLATSGWPHSKPILKAIWLSLKEKSQVAIVHTIQKQLAVCDIDESAKVHALGRLLGLTMTTQSPIVTNVINELVKPPVKSMLFVISDTCKRCFHRNR
ncbi:Aste57867_5353 [Aphanomyces stellatus]|uniref:Aste57867_5353 protein n=1 Tax=Aphanomyces stellatus TaxID=120398 RepID=A0A485KFC5_9STRA|nr:hypothetical protein As57867_005340 [Aphanomyces stellatus]VFT82414.1 Aste57867_5353 [Aphanomyces stellatus]